MPDIKVLSNSLFSAALLALEPSQIVLFETYKLLSSPRQGKIKLVQAMSRCWWRCRHKVNSNMDLAQPHGNISVGTDASFGWPWENNPSVFLKAAALKGMGFSSCRPWTRAVQPFLACSWMVRYELGHMAVPELRMCLKSPLVLLYLWPVISLWLQSLPKLHFNPLSIQDWFYQVFPSVAVTIINCYKSVSSGIQPLKGAFLTQRQGWVSCKELDLLSALHS